METVVSLATLQKYDITANKRGENNMPCPECSPNRRKKNDKCFSYNVEKECGYCSHCESSFVKDNPFEKKEYIKPIFEFENYTKLSDNAVKWFEQRGISQKTVLAMKISEKKEWMPQEDKEMNCIVFPFFKKGELINLKYRDAKKNFKLSSGSELIWYNYDAILNHKEIIFVEGECFPPNAEILTENGWMEIVDYKSGKVAQYDNGLIEFIEPVCKIQKDYNDDLIEVTNKGYYSLTTKNHNILLKNKKGYLKKTAQSLIDNKTSYSIPRVGKLNGEGIYLSDDQIKLMIALSADFSFREGGDIYGAFKKERKVIRIVEILDKLNIRYSNKVVKHGYTSIFIHRGHGLDFCKKEFDHNLISQLSQHQCQLIIEEMVLWDGNLVKGRNQYEYSSKYHSNSSFIQTIAHLSGYVSTIMKRKNQFGEWYKVSVLLSKTTSNTQALKFRKIPFNGKVYCLQMPSSNLVVRQENKITITGNCDALSFIQAGFDNVVSVPNGASIGKMDYFDSSIDDLANVESFIIATDNDLKGVELKNDLIRRFGMERCKTVNFKQYKDANEVLVSEGAEVLQNIIKNAKFITLPDIYAVNDFQNELDDYFENGMPQGKRIEVENLDEIIRWQTGRFGVATGIPSMGKSEFLDFVYSKLNILHGWGIGYYSPESMPLQLHFSKLFPKFIGKEYKKGVITDVEKYNGEEYINKNIYWVNPIIDINIDEILAKFEYLVKAKGCKAFIIDPFNRIEQSANHSDNERLFIKKNLVKMVNFTKKTDSLLFLIAHPTKMGKDAEGNWMIPTPYSISGSADFWNMPDYCLSVHRGQDDNGKFQTYGSVTVQKTKINKTMGDTGVWNYRFNINNGRYANDNLDASPIIYDNSNWITKEEHSTLIEVEPIEVRLPYIDPDEAFLDSFEF